MSKDKSDRSWFGRHKILTGLGIIILIAIISNAASGGNKSDTSNAAGPANSAASSSKPSKKADVTAKIGQPVRDGKFEFTVSSIKCGEPNVSDSSGYLTKTAQGQYCLLKLSVKNIGDESQTLDSTSQYLFNSSGQKYSSDDEATIDINPSNGTFLNDINPGNTVKGVVVFDIPKNQTPATAELHDSAYSDGVKVSLK